MGILKFRKYLNAYKTEPPSGYLNLLDNPYRNHQLIESNKVKINGLQASVPASEGSGNSRLAGTEACDP